MRKKNVCPLLLSVIVFVSGAATLAAQDTSTAPAQDASTTQAPDQAQPVLAQQGPPIFGPQQVAFREAMQPILFDYDNASLDSGAEQAVQQDAQWLKDHPEVKVYVEGFADWRGSVIYNMPLTQDRADAVKDALVQDGISPERIIDTVGFGKITQICEQQDESCWAQNRRVSLVYAPPGFEPNRTEASVR